MLTQEQLQAYLARLGFEEAPEHTLENLNALTYAHQTHIPFETVGIHRTDAIPDTSIDAIYKKVIVDGNGGYCFELNKLFEALLATLGYDVRPVLSRVVRGREGRMPINHRGIIVDIDGTLHSTDVGFGGPMPAESIELAEREQDVRGSIFIPRRIDDAWWAVDRITKAKGDTHDDGVGVRRQTELELCLAAVEDIDFASLNHFCAQHGTLFRDHDVVNLRTDDGFKAYNDGVLTILTSDEKQVVQLETPEEQDAVLLEHFGISY